MAESFKKFIAQERARLSKERKRLLAEQDDLLGRIRAVDRELRAIDAYVDTKSGRDAPAPGATGRRRGRRSSKRDGILRLLKDFGDGLGRGEILHKLGLKGDKAGEQSVSNALSALKKAGAVTAKDRKYKIAA